MREQDHIVATAHAMADAARAAILPHFRHEGLEADTKSTTLFDPVTIADRAAEAAMRAVLAERRPDDAILGEEMGLSHGTSGVTWVLDPIDGTRAFLCGAPSWGVLIAVGGPEGPDYGLIDQPYIGERFEGGFGIARMTGPMGDRSLATRPARPLDQALMMTTFPEIGTTEDEAAFRRVAEQVRLVRYGMDCYAYALLAAGQIDLVIEAGLHPYDIQGPMAVIKAAGGIVTDWTGGTAAQGGRVLAAANADIHAAAMALLAP